MSINNNNLFLVISILFLCLIGIFRYFFLNAATSFSNKILDEEKKIPVLSNLEIEKQTKVLDIIEITNNNSGNLEIISVAPNNGSEIVIGLILLSIVAFFIISYYNNSNSEVDPQILLLNSLDLNTKSLENSAKTLSDINTNIEKVLGLVKNLNGALVTNPVFNAKTVIIHVPSEVQSSTIAASMPESVTNLIPFSGTGYRLGSILESTPVVDSASRLPDVVASTGFLSSSSFLEYFPFFK